MKALIFALLLLVPCITAEAPSDENPWGDFAAVCRADETPYLFDSADSSQVKWHDINLDLPPHEMWADVATQYKDKMVKAIGVVQTMVVMFAGDDAWGALVNLMSGAPDKLTDPYKEEIKAMADLTGIAIEELTLLNLFYEISKGCTSIVAMDPNGKIFHGRNLDFGMMFVWDTPNHEWGLTEALRDLTVNYNFIKDGKVLFKAVTFAGHLGILSGVRPGAYTLSTDTRFGTAIDALTDFFANGLEGRQFLLYAYRDMFTNIATFDEAREYIKTAPLLAPSYVIMGSTDTGVIITRSENGTDHEQVIDKKAKDGWYVLQTNYDWDKPDMYLDQRTDSGNVCMQKLTQARVSKAGLYQVLSSKRNLNKSTVYTSIMSVDDGSIETVLRTCEDPCWFT